MRLSKTLLTVFVFIVVTITIRSQVNLQIGGGIGYVMSSGDLKGTTVDYYAGTNYGLKNGFNFHAKARVGLLSFIGAGEIGYSFLSNNGAYNSAGQGKVDLSVKVLSIKIGPEFHFGVPLMPIDPYVGANLQFNSISGSIEFLGVTHVPSGKYDIAASLRYGLGINGGVIFKIGGMNLDINASYNMLNMFGKSFEADGTKRIDSYGNLNDDKDPLYQSGDEDHFVSDSRSLSTVEIKATLMFGL